MVVTPSRQPDAREGQAGPGRESDRPIVPMGRPSLPVTRGNDRRGKGPKLKGQRRKRQGSKRE